MILFFLMKNFVTEGSSAILNLMITTVIMKELTSINVSEFENSILNPKLKAELNYKIIINIWFYCKKR